MTAAFDIVAELGADGRLSASAARQIAAHLRQMARDVPEGETTPVRVRIGRKLRSTAANALYWSLAGRVAAAYTAAGRAIHPEALHLYWKGLYLPQVVADVERETGEMLDGVDVWHELPDGSRRRTLTTTALTTDAFSRWLDYVASDDDVVAMGVDLSDLLSTAHGGGERTGLRSGRVDEPESAAGVDYAPLSDGPTPPGEYVLADDDAPAAEAEAHPQAHLLSL